MVSTIVLAIFDMCKQQIKNKSIIDNYYLPMWEKSSNFEPTLDYIVCIDSKNMRYEK